nr:MAG TPA: antimicrobial protein [Bacteriophage sp.]
MCFVIINATFGLDIDQVMAYYIVKGKIKPKGGGK